MISAELIFPTTAQARPTKPNRVAFVGTYPPRRCGIATFTQDLRTAAVAGSAPDACPVVALNDSAERHPYPPEVFCQITASHLPDYERAAAFLNRSGIGLVSVQHEFGIFGGGAGGHVLALLRALKIPIVTTLHTVLCNPDPEQRRVMEGLIQVSGRLVVMTERGRRMLLDTYAVPATRIDVIAHGIHDVPFEEPGRFKKLFAVPDRLVLLTFGLLSPNKGIEHVLDALPALVPEFPSVVYLVVGATHPTLVREQGEIYRRSLEERARRNGVEKHVMFYDRYVDLPELQDFIGAADVYITPYLNERQVVSGTLAYAFGAGKAVVSTPYWHAAELLADGRGALVPFADSRAIAREVGALLRDPSRRLALRRRAHQTGREMIWSRAIARYRASFAAAIAAHGATPRHNPPVRAPAGNARRLPALRADHVLRLTDSTGILQHALYTVPNYLHGYCTDDNARALMLALRWEDLGETGPALRPLAGGYLAFLAHALHPGTGRFRNFLGYDRRWLEEAGSEDSHGRAVWALGTCVASSREAGHRRLAGELFLAALPAAASLVHPRTWAFTLLGLDAYLRREPGEERAVALRADLAARLRRRFAEHSREDWHWLADDATYDNARPPQALILAGAALGDRDLLDTGLRALDWLLRFQTSAHGDFQPIGSEGFCHRDGARARFDQQPVEVGSTVSACLAAFHATAERAWLDRARRTFDWFLGGNDLGLALYDAHSGGCHDALHADRVNENQGAESTLAFHLALAELRALEPDGATLRRSAPLEVASL